MTPEQLATDLLTPLWRGISPDYKKRYARTIWQQFEDNLRSAAYTAKLSTFLAKITTRMGIVIFADDTGKVTAVMQQGEDKIILKMLRDDTTLCVLLVRVANEERKERAKKRHERKEQQDEDLSLRGENPSNLFDKP